MRPLCPARRERVGTSARAPRTRPPPWRQRGRGPASTRRPRARPRRPPTAMRSGPLRGPSLLDGGRPSCATAAPPRAAGARRHGARRRKNARATTASRRAQAQAAARLAYGRAPPGGSAHCRKGAGRPHPPPAPLRGRAPAFRPGAREVLRPPRFLRFPLRRVGRADSPLLPCAWFKAHTCFLTRKRRTQETAIHLRDAMTKDASGSWLLTPSPCPHHPNTPVASRVAWLA